MKSVSVSWTIQMEKCTSFAISCDFRIWTKKFSFGTNRLSPFFEPLEGPPRSRGAGGAGAQENTKSPSLCHRGLRGQEEAWMKPRSCGSCFESSALRLRSSESRMNLSRSAPNQARMRSETLCVFRTKMPPHASPLAPSDDLVRLNLTFGRRPLRRNPRLSARGSNMLCNGKRCLLSAVSLPAWVSVCLSVCLPSVV